MVPHFSLFETLMVSKKPPLFLWGVRKSCPCSVDALWGKSGGAAAILTIVGKLEDGN